MNADADILCILDINGNRALFVVLDNGYQARMHDGRVADHWTEPGILENIIPRLNVQHRTNDDAAAGRWLRGGAL